MNLFERAKSWLPKTMKAAAGIQVFYSREGNEIEITAWVGRTLFSIAQVGGNRIEWGDRDYMIPAVAIESTFGSPIRGDRIREVLESGNKTFEIMAPSGEPDFRWSDGQQTTYRVHTKEVTT